jgi:hypothetical protein
MKRPGKIASIILFAMVFGSFLCSSDIISAKEPEHEKTKEERLEEARESSDMAISYEERGDKRFKVSPGKAQMLYEHAEDYFLKAVFIYKETGIDYNEDYTAQIAANERKQRAVHIKTGKARKKSRRSY